jgi:hypothetical protein
MSDKFGNWLIGGVAHVMRPTSTPIRIDRVSILDRRRLVLLIVLILLVGTRDAFTQSQQSHSSVSAGDLEWHFRYELFQMLLEERGLAVEPSLEHALASPQESVVVLVGTLNPQQVDAEKLIPFVSNGGCVLLATDRTGRLGTAASFIAGPISSSDPSTQYQELTDCLRVLDVDASHTVMQGVREIVVNRSGWLSLPPATSMNWQILATVPQTCRPIRSRGQPLIAVSQISRPSAGFLMIAADPTLFTNSMMWHGDNAVLAIRISEELCRREKKRLTFVVDGRPLASYRRSPMLQESGQQEPSPPAPQSPPPVPAAPPDLTWEQRLQVLNAVIQHVEESNIHNEALINNPRHPHQQRYPRVILLILAIATSIWLLSVLRKQAGDRPSEPAPLIMKSAKRMVSESASSARDYASILRTLTRELCRELTGSSVPQDWQQSLSNPTMLPTLTKAQRRDLEEIVKLAVDRDMPHISASRLRQVGSMIRQIRSIHRSANDAGNDLQIANSPSLFSAG